MSKPGKLGKLARFLARPAADRRLLAEAAVRLLWARSVLVAVPFARIARGLERPVAVPAEVSAETIRRIRWAVETAARVLPVSLTCLPQGLAACGLLRARGGSPAMYYGVASRGEGRFEAHVWVEAAGMPVVGHRVADEFTVLTVFSPGGKAAS